MKINKRELIAQSSVLLLAGCAPKLVNSKPGNTVTNSNVIMPNYNRPVIIAHRGASGHRPEHTVGAYTLAVEMGADFIEPDLVFTKDGHLICRHENNIKDTTDIANHPEFADRKTTKTIDGEQLSGWFAEDFTLAELKTLRCKERLPQLRPLNTKYDGMYEILTFEEILKLRAELSQKHNRVIGVYPETKHPSYFASIGFEHDKPLIDTLNSFGLNQKDSPVFIQSFETENLKRLHRKTDVKLIQLMSAKGVAWDSQTANNKTYDYLKSPEGLKEISDYAFGVGPERAMIFMPDANNVVSQPSSLIKDAHSVGLKLHPWTFRAENYFLPDNYRLGDKASADYLALHGDILKEIRAFLDAGVDGVFSDFPDMAFKAVGDFVQIK